MSSQELISIKKYMYCACMSHAYKEFRLMILSLIKLRDFIVVSFDMLELSPVFIDFLVDVEMWRWIETIQEPDWIASEYIINDLTNILITNDITKKDRLWVH